MAEVVSLARPYALAAFQQAQEEGALSSWSEVLDFVSALAADSELATVISDPRVAQERLTQLMLDLCAERLSSTQENFLRLLITNRRLQVVGKITELFEARRAEQEGRSRVEVRSAFALEPRFEQVISGVMAKRLGNVVDLSVVEDPGLIGGVVIRSGDLVIDLSLRGRLKQLSLQLT